MIPPLFGFTDGRRAETSSTRPTPSIESATPPAAPTPASAQSNPPESSTRTIVGRALAGGSAEAAGGPLALSMSVTASAVMRDRRGRIRLRRRPCLRPVNERLEAPGDWQRASPRALAGGPCRGYGHDERGMVEFRMLGPLEVVEGDRRRPLGGPKQRAVLAILLLHRGEV